MQTNIGTPIQPIKPIESGITDLQYTKIKKVKNESGFEDIFKNALGLIDETNKYQIEAENMQTAYVTGDTDDIIGLNLAQAKASSSLTFTAQVTNKIINAYQEIMRINL